MFPLHPQCLLCGLRFRRITIALLFPLLSTLPFAAQAQQANTDSLRQAELGQKITTMQDILQSISALEEELGLKEKEYKKAKTEEGQKLIEEDIKVINERLSLLDKDFTMLSTGIDQVSFFENEEKELDWKAEIGAIFSPLLYELKEITAQSREIERLRNTVPLFERRITQIEEALREINDLDNSNKNPQINSRLIVLAEFWNGHKQEQEAQMETMKLQLEKLEKEKKSFGELSGDVSRVFFKSRGKNLLLAVLMFILTFFILRYFHKLLHKHTSIGRSGKRRFLSRLIDITYYFFTIIASMAFFLMVLYMASDWVLLGLSILLILGLIWASKKALPSFFEQAKLLLNLGAVREGERVVYKGVPYLVESLNLYTELSNKALEGGYIRLPIKDLTGLRSRPFSEEEPWFPTSKGDWIKLSDGFYGKVFIQTPELVGINTQRGSYKTYPMKEFLSNRPQNLSRNTFSVNRTVEIAHRYRDRVNTEIAPAMQTFFEEAIKKESYGDLLLQVIVELKEITPSSLGLICILKFKGDLASEYFELGWKIEQVALDALNHLGIEIPHPHLTLSNGKTSLQPAI
ncbi:MAG: mechanosensitive ion channel family protein [Bacteroidota bacterium]